MGTLIVTGVRQQRRLLVIVSAGAFMANLDTCIVNVCLPTIAREYHATTSAVSLVVLAYLLCEVSFLLLFGKLGERWGITQVYLAGFALFTAGSLLCGLAPSLPALIGFRALQGVGGSMIFAVILAFPGLYLPADRRAPAMGILTLVSALGVAVGPPLGGLITGTLGWHWIFFVNVPVGIVALVAGVMWLPRAHPAGDDRELDVPGAILSFLALLMLLLSLNRGQEWGWGSLPILALFAGALVCGFAFVVRERLTTHPLLDLGLFRHRRFSLAAAAFLIAMATTGGAQFLLPFYLQELRGLSPFVAGATLMVVAAGQFVGPWAGGLADRYGTRSVCGAGLTLAIAAFALFCFLNDVSPLWFIVLSLALLGLSQGLNKAPNITMALEDVPATGKPQAGSVVSVARSLGLALGVVAFETVFSEVIARGAPASAVGTSAAATGATAAGVSPGLLERGFTAAFLVGIALSVAALILTVATGPSGRQTAR